MRFALSLKCFGLPYYEICPRSFGAQDLQRKTGGYRFHFFFHGNRNDSITGENAKLHLKHTEVTMEALSDLTSSNKLLLYHICSRNYYPYA